MKLIIATVCSLSVAGVVQAFHIPRSNPSAFAGSQRYLYVDSKAEEGTWFPSVMPKSFKIKPSKIQQEEAATQENEKKVEEESSSTVVAYDFNKVKEIMSSMKPEKDVPQLLREDDAEVFSLMISNIALSFVDGVKAAVVVAMSTGGLLKEDADDTAMEKKKNTQVLDVIIHTAIKSTRQTVTAVAAFTALALKIGDRLLLKRNRTQQQQQQPTKSVVSAIPKPPTTKPPMYLLLEQEGKAVQNRSRASKVLSFVRGQ